MRIGAGIIEESNDTLHQQWMQLGVKFINDDSFAMIQRINDGVR